MIPAAFWQIDTNHRKAKDSVLLKKISWVDYKQKSEIYPDFIDNDFCVF